ncbi:hypothetical protein JTE90_007360 [Oedothorax gibbosus]|uniref:Uncharacterized protein n=1 Tax=Oedothorax gibbosus TaxID=931172 RepID=A0AAV6TJF6_9ARAC|nr:hypothetical protein JTE90_007360 [Oedothorax gibbosus]
MDRVIPQGTNEESLDQTARVGGFASTSEQHADDSETPSEVDQAPDPPEEMESLPTEDQPPPTQVSIQSVSVVEENTSVKVVADTQVSSPSSSVLEDNTSVSDAFEALNFDILCV